MDHDSIAPGALKTPVFTRLKGRRIVLASGSPRRTELLASVGIHPEVVPSMFEEDLPKSDFVGEAVYEYPVANAGEKALEVYKRLVLENPADPPELVIGADTVVIADEQILEKPRDKMDNLRMLADLSGKPCTVITGVAIVHPVLYNPGYKLRTVVEQTRLYFADIPAPLLQAYVDDGEGIDCAGGFAIQGKGALLVRGIEGDYNNVVGFPLFSVLTHLHELIEDEELDLEGIGA
ncbi:hypothetical protein MVES1_003001 [Malassezia vespertilionis]|uniref:Maf-like protein n=1 Tax=Malassezia vespertilionis TaxID=2020962 RepID=A0A2N1J8V0_9BASI|nr:uncharacterized protein MVES1_003001 [Malassezia vespertilionis]PKI82987.1 hypothetical protein MVES_002841 [Malassezia vespertilionis]WFD07632.1 hypothetical protein MVES1_003001 [Malassezia vespertilionis]